MPEDHQTRLSLAAELTTDLSSSMNTATPYFDDEYHDDKGNDENMGPHIVILDSYTNNNKNIARSSGVQFGFVSSNGWQLFYHWLLAVMIGISLRMTTFPQALVMASSTTFSGAKNKYSQETMFLVTFGFTKAFSNIFVGWMSDRKQGRRVPHAAGWVAGVVLALILLLYNWQSHDNGTQRHREHDDNNNNTQATNNMNVALVFAMANIFLGMQQGMTWTTNIFMFMDILGPRHRALASGISNSTGYISSACAAYLAAAISVQGAFRMVLLSSVVGLWISTCLLKDTTRFVEKEVAHANATKNKQNVDENAIIHGGGRHQYSQVESSSAFQDDPNHNHTAPLRAESQQSSASFRNILLTTCWYNRSTAMICVGGLLTNLVTSFAWGFVMIWAKEQALANLQLAHISSAFTFAKAFAQIGGGHCSDRYWSRKTVLTAGFTIAAMGLLVTAMAGMVSQPQDDVTATSFSSSNSTSPPLPEEEQTSGTMNMIYVCLLTGGLIMGSGVGSVYCVMTGAISDHTRPEARASAIGVYKLWRDSGYAFGGLLTGWLADASNGSFAFTTLSIAGLVIVFVLLLCVFYQEKERFVEEEEDGKHLELQKLHNNNPSSGGWPLKAMHSAPL